MLQFTIKNILKSLDRTQFTLLANEKNVYSLVHN